MQKAWLIFAYVALFSVLAFGYFVWPTQWILPDRGPYRVNRFTGQLARMKAPAGAYPTVPATEE